MMQAPNWTDFLQCAICTNKFDQTDVLPISLSCGHTVCTRCLGKLKTRTCPYDKASIRPDAETLPPNTAILQLLGYKWTPPMDNAEVLKLVEADKGQYSRAVAAIMELAIFLQPLAEHGITAAVTYLTKPMLKKLVNIINCQILEAEGQSRALRSAHSIADRTVTELLVMHQNQQQISTLLWTAVRNRGCQFLGPIMQEEALKLILMVLESGKLLSRKNIVIFVVQRLSTDFPQASKTSVGHVVQLLYRASCFNVEKRDDDSSLMQLKEEFRSYECLRREHDSQIIRMAMEAGLRISPEQWSTLLYGDHKHKSDMQSIIDKLIAQGAASSGLSELIVAIGRSQDPYQLSEKVVPHLEVIFKAPRIQPDRNSDRIEWEHFAVVMEALLATLQGFSTYMQIQSGRFKTGMCPHLSKPDGCPKGDHCTYAHTEEERERFRNMVKPTKMTKPRSGDQRITSIGRPPSVAGVRNGRFSGDHGLIMKSHDGTPHSSLSSLDMMASGPSSLNDQQYSELIHHLQQNPGERMGPITAPVLPTQEWHNVHRGVATVNHTYQPAEKCVTPYMTPDQVYPSHLPSEGLPYAVNQPLSKIDLIRMQHEAVKQSVEGSTYHREMVPPPRPSPYAIPYSHREWLPGTIPDGQGSLSSDSFLSSNEFFSTGSVRGEMIPGGDTMTDQQLIATMEQLEIARSSSTLSKVNTSSPTEGCPQVLSSSQNTNVSNAAIAVAASSSGSMASTHSSSSNPANSQGDLEAEIIRLKEQLRERDETIQQQKVQLHYTRGSGGGVLPSSAIQSGAQYPSGQQVFSNGVIVGDTSPHQTALVQQQQHQHSYSGPLQYPSQHLQAAAAAVAALVAPSCTGGYYSSAPSANYPPHQWSGPQISPYSSSSSSSLNQTTPPGTGYIIPPTATLTPQMILHSASARQQPQPHLVSDDSMLAAYLQIVEQTKAAAAATGSGYQATPTYNPTQGPCYYHRH